ncbi:CDP-diacylglycerol--glycerol-3-phosphate 3-phosphatidyltransferase [Phyllobacterium ifriqiyense]|uniref:CDP-diacylglycerol--glycerol-3-phosphate 3-phosphatidyltransferase n=1 Tax=Phyllobacterium ifriqiyense TaxID=314238 RepID=A0ABU0S8R6_9HYPH|nr:CDP-alcohol phosphatidyltransferase family protein [Phyllobacterium ifriqiyense]MDQ0997125.1 CDP-diacylglycerol--glycerol-3-phosphate 3-phosphatidyltransferase [Phyllobacterium ifriqiyense]
MPTLYSIKPAFQNLLRPLVGRLVAIGATANQVTVAATLISVATGVVIALFPDNTLLFWLLPLVLFVRMALNAIDGMMAREFGQASKLGAYLNEIGDIVSDVALILPFTLVWPFEPVEVVAFAITAIIAEYAGVLGVMTGGGRAYDGPFGKSDRALALGIIAALIGSGLDLPSWFGWVFPAMALLSVFTMINRIRAGLRRANS